MTKLALAVLLALVLALPLPSIGRADEAGLDCQALIASLYKVMEASLSGNNSTDLLNLYSKAVLPPPISQLHGSVVEDLVDLHDALNTVFNESGVAATLEHIADLSKRLRTDVESYVKTLTACSVDKSTASLYSGKVYSLLDRVDSLLNQTMVYLATSRSSSSIKVYPSSQAIAPGDTVSFKIVVLEEGVFNGSLVLAVLPGLTTLVTEEFSVSTGVNKIDVSIPPASKLGEVLPAGKYTVVAHVEIRDSANSSALSLLTLDLYTNNITVNVPRVVRPGELVSANIVPAEGCPASVLLDRDVLFEGYLREEGVVVTFKIPDNATPGTHYLVVRLEPGFKYLGGTVSIPLLVERPEVPVLVEAPSVYVSLSNAIPVLVRALGNASRIVVVTSGGERDVSKDGIAYLNGGLGLFDRVEAVIEVYPVEGSVYQPAVHRVSVLYINPLTLLSIVLAATFVLPLLVAHERGVYLVLKHVGSRSGRRSSPRSVSRFINYLSSQLPVAGLYYRLLNELGFRKPEAQETLREHFASLRINTAIKSLLWRLLVLVEKELYSRDKPKREEAESVAREIRNAET
ncbi:hypothetical protein TCELL_0440 [Thermogladius calderae 1633]|uniref:DUF4129 domain-containing protein n=1 Tax=Thermogladius calderae (strain DSM 22663 / VKM B-2946 / 1633) TaxID=1184251 RepID=I3TDM7_THEC1|nr:hypothetical protein [Thermogladius calderae]AFK50865.1 hypothetical protein TCELL_0440 [Thermogladius calderae 1633]